MADYYPLIASAVAKLPENSVPARRALYERVRGMLVRQLRTADPTISAADIERELRSLEDVIDRIEAESATPTTAERRAAATSSPPRARAGGARRVATGIFAVVLIAGVLAGGYFAYPHFWQRAGGAPIAVVPAGDDTVAIKGFLAGYRGAAEKPTDVLLLHARCGATLLELDVAAKAVNPSGHLDHDGRFAIAVKKAFVSEIVKVGVRATTAPPDELRQTFLVLGFFVGGKLVLLTGPDGKTIKISPQGQMLNAGALGIAAVIPPALIVTRKPDGNIYASGGAFVLDEAC